MLGPPGSLLQYRDIPHPPQRFNLPLKSPSPFPHVSQRTRDGTYERMTFESDMNWRIFESDMVDQSKASGLGCIST